MKSEIHAPLRKEVRWLSLTLKIFLPFASAYFLSYLLRNVNAVLAPALAHDFDLDAGQLGSLTAACFLGASIALAHRQCKHRSSFWPQWARCSSAWQTRRLVCLLPGS